MQKKMHGTTSQVIIPHPLLRIRAFQDASEVAQEGRGEGRGGTRPIKEEGGSEIFALSCQAKRKKDREAKLEAEHREHEADHAPDGATRLRHGIGVRRESESLLCIARPQLWRLKTSYPTTSSSSTPGWPQSLESVSCPRYGALSPDRH